MSNNVSRRHFLAGSTAAAGALSLGGASAFAADPLKVGFVYVGPVGDFGWTHGHDLGRKAIEKEFGDKVETTFVEKVAEGPDAERVIRQLASSGNKLIFTTSFGFMNPTIKVAKQFPDVKFEHATGFMTAKNVSAYNARFYEGRAVIGTMAGHMTKTGKFGYIASFPIPEVVMGINAFILAARKVRPDAEIKVVWVNSWFDPGKEADATKTLIDQGCDIITQHTDSPAPIQTAGSRGVWCFGQASDMSSFSPEYHATAILDVWDNYYVERTRAVMDGSWETSNVWQGMKEGMVQMSPYNERLPAEVVEAAETVRKGILDGSYLPFAGPIKDQDGKERIAAGEAMDDGALLSMDWYVEGVTA
ncbi:BMP family ABC transporter substrate-binding protein [Pelagibius litoralis]|uniref:BMP family ABC transporter substrate-binding protein n=1 Tax=Pelagibius litoralis TaxID=374515 RepID=A0A967C242_9PROT|nr:BMP family ABC transporter substrate-binding protein [Pelagibius litoralis]NIA68686.1 BMP family ABC transporter substrate-binding protein [Pelagibius litoralis]